MNTPTQAKQSELFRKYYRPLEPILQKPQNRVYTTTVLSFLTVSLFIWYAIRPTVQTILALRREIRDSTAVNEQMETKIAALVEAQATYQDVVPRLGLLKEAVPETPDMIEVMIQLRDLARSVEATVSGASLGSVPLTVEKNKTVSPEPKPTDQPSDVSASQNSLTKNQPQNQNQTYTPVIVTVEGTYESMKQFILGIYSLRRIVTIADLTLIPRITEIGSQRGSTLSMTLKINAYSTSE